MTLTELIIIGIGMLISFRMGVQAGVYKERAARALAKPKRAHVGKDKA